MQDLLTISAPPAQANARMSLADLRQIKRDWIAAARDLDYPAICWSVLRNLGHREKFGILREAWLWQSGTVVLVGDESATTYNPAHRAYIVRRVVAAYVLPQELDPRWQNPAEKALMNGDQVMHWGWLMADTSEDQIIEEDEGEKKDSLIFVPGQWMNAILAVQHQAEQKAQAEYLADIERQRQQLLSELLVGKAV
ncbi:MAG: hypothetical protein RBS68_14195 [Anaerolineales bacterium]|jgi:hypothetical protein|nr:hypothetical protein [Anaerolineales bacterium]